MKKLFLVAFLCAFVSSLHAQSPRAISYQGMLRGVSVGNHSMTLTLYGGAAGTMKLWQSTQTVPLDSSGVFSVLLGADGSPLPDAPTLDRPLWLGVALDGQPELTRSPINASMFALNVADSSITSKKLKTNYVSSISVNGQTVTGLGTNLNLVGGDGIDLTWLPDQSTLTLSGVEERGSGKILSHDGTSDYWGQTGNSGTNTDTNYVGTSDSVAFEIHVNNNGNDTVGNGRIMRYEPTGLTPNIIGGYNGNSIGSGAYGAVISGGGSSVGINTIATPLSTIAGGQGNSITGGEFGTISGGTGNKVKSLEATVGGGIGNTAGNTSDPESQHQTVGGGHGNLASGDDAVVAGGESDQATGGHSAVAGGYTNTATQQGSEVGGGEYNNSTGDHSTLAGGESNTASGDHATLLGGKGNKASGAFSSLLGGEYLYLGDSSVGFNGGTALGVSPVDLSGFSNVGYFGNVDLWIGNIDSSARELRFYSPQKNHTYSGALFSSFQAGPQPGNINYTLPDTIPIEGQFLKAETVVGTSVQLQWDTVTGSGGGLPGWQIQGNSSVPPPTYYLGTQDSEAFEIHIHNNTLDTSGGNQRVMRYSEGATSPNILGGSSANTMMSGLNGTAILSGGDTTLPNRIQQVVTGAGTHVSSDYSVVAGGEGNITWSDHDAIVGGRGNVMNGDSVNSGGNFIGSGDSNMIGYGSPDNVIGGGKKNIIANAWGTIGGGFGNLLNGPGTLNVIAGGLGNTVGGILAVNANITCSSILGGDSNMIRQNANYSVVLGGAYNTIDSGVIYSTLGGGLNNTIQTIGNNDTGSVCMFTIGRVFTPGYAVLAGGQKDTVRSTLGTVTGGYKNVIDTNGGSSVIVGGDSNYVGAGTSAIGGGYHNTITTSAYGSTIPGGVGLKAAASGQFVAGTYNIPDSTTGPNGALAIFGNGMEDTITGRSNAVKIWKPGYLTVYGTPGTTGNWEGSIYKNNTVEAWGYGLAGDTALADYSGIWAISHPDTGVYQITLLVQHADGSPITAAEWTAHPKNLSVVATLGQTAAGIVPGMIVATPLLPLMPGFGVFQIHTFNQLGQKSDAYDYQFHVILDIP